MRLKPMRALSILFTNNTLAARGGSELWVRDVCRALVARGHHPIAFSLVTGEVAEDLRAATVPVVDDLRRVGITPDLIHGHHHLETLIAALHFPGVPIVHFCHGWSPWEERPLLHPSIARYVAVDETCADRLIAENGIPAGRVDRLLNFVDMARFLPRAPLPVRPSLALILNNGADEGGYAAVIREACRRRGITVELAGINSGRSVTHPEALLAGFDLVFARGRSALEAMAVGCSVILADRVGAGPLVTEPSFERMRSANFGIRWLQQPHSVEWYGAQIDGYDAAAAGRISARLRSEADLETAIDRLLDIYAGVLDEARRHPRPSERQEFDLEAQRAASRHISSVTRQFKQAHELAAAAARLSAELTAAHGSREEAFRERERLMEQVADLTRAATAADSANRQLSDTTAAMERRNQHLVADLADAHRQRQHLTEELADARRRGLRASEDVAEVTRVNQHLTRERDALAQRVAAYEALPSLRLRNRLLQVPLVGELARRAARTAARRLSRQQRSSS